MNYARTCFYRGQISPEKKSCDKNQCVHYVSWAYEQDLFTRYTNSQWWAIRKFDLSWDTVQQRTKSKLLQYWRSNYVERDTLSKKYGYKTEFLVCLAQTETGIWHQKKTQHNYFNCGNNDRWDTRTFSSLEDSIRALHNICLNWTYLRHKTTLSHLAPNHRDSSCQSEWTEQCRYVYASSEENRMNNMRNCLSNIHNTQITTEYSFRLN